MATSKQPPTPGPCQCAAPKATVRPWHFLAPKGRGRVSSMFLHCRCRPVPAPPDGTYSKARGLTLGVRN